MTKTKLAFNLYLIDSDLCICSYHIRTNCIFSMPEQLDRFTFLPCLEVGTSSNDGRLVKKGRISSYQHDSIRFTMEIEINNSFPFLDVSVSRQSNERLHNWVYCISTDTNRYLHAQSHHHSVQKRSVLNAN